MGQIKSVNQKLNDFQKSILFEAQTEKPFSGKLLHFDKTGDYTCVNCGTILFDSATKFDSGSGWPSFYDIKHTKAVNLIEDVSGGMQRIEVRCGGCDGHLGHVFNDTPSQPTGLRFCINSAVLEFHEKGNK